MRDDLEESFVDCSGRIILECKGCGENTILLGLEEDWSPERSEFGCQCGRNLTLADQANEEVVSVRRLLRGTIGAGPR